jgi:tetratricopeptide (TPR) repeat protein
MKGDFIRQGKRAWIHRAAFTGPFSITMKENEFTGMARKFVVCFKDRESPFYACTVFVGKGEGWASLERRTPGGGQESEVKKELLPSLCRRRRVVAIKAGRSRIGLYLNGRRVLSIAAPKNAFGFWGLHHGTFEELTCEGPLEPSWMQGKIDAALEKQRQAFARKYRPRKVLPGWLFVDPDVEKTRPDWKRFPVSLSEADADRYGRLRHEILTRPLEEAGRTLRDEFAGDDDPLVRAWLSALYHERQGQLSEAVERLGEVLGGNPRFKRALYKRAEVQGRLGHVKGAMADWRAIIALAPEYGPAYNSLARLILDRGRVDEAMIVLDGAYGRVSSRKRLEATRALALKRVYGPDWPRVFDYKTTNYHVLSDIDQKTCYRAARILEDAYRQYRVHLKWVKRAEAGRFRVYLFSGREGYLNYTKDVLGVSPTRSAGLYSRFLKQLLIWNAPQRDAMMRTVRHEGFHQYFDRIVSDPPSWINEGLAEYFEAADYQNGRWNTGLVRRDHLDRLKRGAPPLGDLVKLPPKTFYGRKALRNYAQAWAFVHFLLHGPKANQRLFDRLLEALQSEGDRAATGVKKILNAGTLQALEPAFRAYLERLRMS